MPFEYTIHVLQDRLQLLSMLPESQQGKKKIAELRYTIEEISKWDDDEGDYGEMI